MFFCIVGIYIFSTGLEVVVFFCFFFFQAEDGIRDFCLSRGLGDVYKRQVHVIAALPATLYLLYGLCFVLLRQNKAIFDQFCGLIIFGKADISPSLQTALIIEKKMLYKIPINRILYNIFR